MSKHIIVYEENKEEDAKLVDYESFEELAGKYLRFSKNGDGR